MTEINVNEIKALIALLEDPDNEIFTVVSNKLFQMGGIVIPYLEKAWETCINQEMQSKMENLIHEIQYNNVFEELKQWKDEGATDNLKGAYIVAKFQYPDLKFEAIEKSIDKITKDVWIELNDNLTALEKVRVMNHIFFEIHKFSPNFNNFYSAQNYYLNQVLETKRGNPISLAIVYAAVAQRVEMPVFGVNLPKNFILAFKDLHSHEFEDDILFYINPYNKGSVLGRREIDYFLKQQNIPPRKDFYLPCSNTDIVKRLINNLINSYESTGQHDKVEQLKKLMNILG